MGKTVDQEVTSNCPICYCDVTEWTRPKRCKHRYCYECLSTWVKKGKKNCPLCRRTFNSVLKVHRKRFLKANGTTYDKEECEEIKNEDIKARPAVKDLKAMIPGPFQFLLGMNENQALVMTGMAVVVPPWPLWSQMLLSTMHFPLMPLAL